MRCSTGTSKTWVAFYSSMRHLREGARQVARLIRILPRDDGKLNWKHRSSAYHKVQLLSFFLSFCLRLNTKVCFFMWFLLIELCRNSACVPKNCHGTALILQMFYKPSAILPGFEAKYLLSIILISNATAFQKWIENGFCCQPCGLAQYVVCWVFLWGDGARLCLTGRAQGNSVLPPTNLSKGMVLHRQTPRTSGS